MNHVTFLLGAGASANAIPMMYEIPLHLGLMADYLEKYAKTNSSEKYISDINELLTHLNDFNTIDNYARVLSQNKDSSNSIQLKKLKSILCGLFMFEQLKKKNEVVNKYDNIKHSEIEKIKRTIDLRYKSFFGKVLTIDKLDERINIISWNYDMQLEIGLESNIGYDYDEIHKACIIYPHPSCQPNKEHTFGINLNFKPKIVKLNGTAGIFLEDDGFHNIYLNQKEYFEDRVETLLEVHKEVTRYKQYNPFIKFAWESNEHTNRTIEYASSIISRTNILVVIGYSFPDFNRAIDQRVFSGNNISELFVQIPFEDFDNVKYNMRSSLDRLVDKSVNIKTLREFFIPHQFIPSY